MHFRLYEDKDVAGVVECHLEQEKRLGKRMDLPDLLDKPVLVAHVVESSEGKIKGAAYVEAIAEVCLIGTDPAITAITAQHAVEMIEGLKRRGLRICRLLVPKWMPAKQRAILKAELKQIGFTSTNREYDHYMLDLRPPKANNQEGA